MSQQIKKGGALLEIKVLDHVILTAAAHSSLADDGLMWINQPQIRWNTGFLATN
jgi:hypothetical protein